MRCSVAVASQGQVPLRVHGLEKRMQKRSNKQGRPSAADAGRTEKPPVPSAGCEAIDADRAKLLAIEYGLFHYPTLYIGGIPRPCPPPQEQDWVVPVVLASPVYGILGQVGELRIDGRTGEVVAGTDRAQVVRAGEQLYRGRKDAAAALRPRKR